jgi:hypothetical protein
MRLGEVDDRDLRRWLDNAGLDNAGVDGPAVGSSSPPCVPSSGQSTIHSRT